VSCLGNDRDTVAESLRAGTSGIRYRDAYEEMGLRSRVAGSVEVNAADWIDRKPLRFMGEAAVYTHVAMQQAIKDSGLGDELVSNPRAGIIAGTGGGSPAHVMASADTCRERGVKKVGPYVVPRTMGSTISACLATSFHIKGVNYSISSACSTSAHCIGNGAELIQLGKQDIVFAGGGEEEHWVSSMMFDAMGALSTKYNDTPKQASRPYD